jgi:hypothetical protein
MSAWLEFINRKVDAALTFAGGMAAELWPGKDHIDGKRFVELWVRYADPTLDPVLISVPFVRKHLRQLGRNDDVQAIDEARPQMFGLGHSSRILLGSDVDMKEAPLLTITSLKSSDIRRYSYPVLFYKHVRSNLAHEYKLSEDAASHFLTRRKANVSYNNRVDMSEAEMTRRLIHFHLDWIAKIVRSIASNVYGVVDAYDTLGRPDRWWIDG